MVHEAGPLRYGLVRALRERGYMTEVIAPSRVARHPADRIKTDRRDALLLARLHRAGELTAIVVPEPADEALRDLVRAREDAMNDLKRARLRLRSFLLRQGRSYSGKRWGPARGLLALAALSMARSYEIRVKLVRHRVRFSCRQRQSLLRLASRDAPRE